MNTTCKHHQSNKISPHGGQRIISLFGINLTGERPAPAPIRRDDQPRLVNGQSFAHRRAIMQAKVNAAPAKAATVDLHAPAAPVLPAARRKVPPTLIKGALSPFSRDGLEKIDHAALNRQEQREIEEEEARARAATTPAMKQAARDSQRCEEREWYAAAEVHEVESYALFLSEWFPRCNALMAQEDAQ